TSVITGASSTGLSGNTLMLNIFGALKTRTIETIESSATLVARGANLRKSYAPYSLFLFSKTTSSHSLLNISNLEPNIFYLIMRLIVKKTFAFQHFYFVTIDF